MKKWRTMRMSKKRRERRMRTKKQQNMQSNKSSAINKQQWNPTAYEEHHQNQQRHQTADATCGVMSGGIRKVSEDKTWPWHSWWVTWEDCARMWWASSWLRSITCFCSVSLVFSTVWGELFIFSSIVDFNCECDNIWGNLRRNYNGLGCYVVGLNSLPRLSYRQKN